MDIKGLTDKQRAFCEHYLQLWNATEAARRAGYKGSDATLAVIGSENIRKPKIRSYLESRFSSTVMSADEILSRLGAMARGELPTSIREGKTIIKDFDTRSALIDLGKTYALFKERVQVEDWRSEVIRLLYDGELTPDQVSRELGDDLAQELFKSAGISVSTDSETQETSSEDN